MAPRKTDSRVGPKEKGWRSTSARPLFRLLFELVIYPGEWTVAGKLRNCVDLPASDPFHVPEDCCRKARQSDARPDLDIRFQFPCCRPDQLKASQQWAKPVPVPWRKKDAVVLNRVLDEAGRHHLWSDGERVQDSIDIEKQEWDRRLSF